MSGLLKTSALFALGLALSALSACGSRRCDLGRITQLIQTDIRDHNRSPAEYLMEPPRKDGQLIYVGMSLKMSPPYHRHYWIDPKRCAIARMQIDQ